MGIVVTDERITRAIAELVQVDPAQVTPTTRLDELVSDSFLLVQLAMDIQDEFDVIFHAEDLDDVDVVADLIGLIRSRR
jgi:acyl carrier protein